MRCHVCGGKLEPGVANLPFRLSATAVVVIKSTPVLECSNCTESSLADDVMARVEELLSRTDEAAELEVVAYAA